MSTDEFRRNCIEEKIPIIEEDVRYFINSLIKDNDLNNLLEIGSAVGYSAISFCLDNHHLTVTTVEKDPLRYQKAIDNISTFDLNDRITLYNADGLNYVDHTKYDVIFIDAAKAQYKHFLDRYLPNLSNKGYVVIDNMNFHGLVENPSLSKNRNTRQLVGKIKKFVEYVLALDYLDTTLYPEIGDGLMVIRRRE